MVFDVPCFREMNKRMSEEQAKKTYERALKIEQEFGEYFTGIFSLTKSFIIFFVASVSE